MEIGFCLARMGHTSKRLKRIERKVRTMKKASAQVIFNSETMQIINLTIKHGDALIPMIDYSNDINLPYKYANFQQMYSAILTLAKANNFYFSSYEAFEVIWYDVSFIDIVKHPYEFKKYGFRKEGN